MLVIAPDTAITAYGRARVLEEKLTDGVVAVVIDIERVQDHDRPTFDILGGVSWRWSDAEAEARDEEVRTALKALKDRLEK